MTSRLKESRENCEGLEMQVIGIKEMKIQEGEIKKAEVTKMVLNYPKEKRDPEGGEEQLKWIRRMGLHEQMRKKWMEEEEEERRQEEGEGSEEESKEGIGRGIKEEGEGEKPLEWTVYVCPREGGGEQPRGRRK